MNDTLVSTTWQCARARHGMMVHMRTTSCSSERDNIGLHGLLGGVEGGVEGGAEDESDDPEALAEALEELDDLSGVVAARAGECNVTTPASKALH